MRLREVQLTKAVRPWRGHDPIAYFLEETGGSYGSDPAKFGWSMWTEPQGVAIQKNGKGIVVPWEKVDYVIPFEALVDPYASDREIEAEAKKAAAKAANAPAEPQGAAKNTRKPKAEPVDVA